MKIGKLIGKPEAVAFVSSVIVGTVTHMFALTNVLHNFDDIAVQPLGYGTGLPSGRWFLSLVGNRAIQWFGSYNLPYVNGLLFILLLAAAAAFFVSVFRLGAKSAACVGAVFVTAPAVTSCMLFRYTAPYYGLAILLAVLAAWVLEKYKWGLPLSMLFTAMSMGIYQAYVPLTIGMFVLLVIQRSLRRDGSLGKLIGRGIYYCVTIGLSVVLYYGILQFLLNHHGKELLDYSGISSMGQVSPAQLPALVKDAVAGFVSMPLSNYCDLAQTGLVGIGYLALEGLALTAMAYVLLTKVRKVLPAVFTGILCLCFALAVNFIVIMVSNGRIYTLMVFPFVLVLCAPLVIWETVEVPEGKPRRQLVQALGSGIVALILFITINYGYQANANYSALYFANRQTENYLNSFITQVRMTEGFDTGKEWVVIGNIQDPLFYSPWDSVPMYGGNASIHGMINAYSRDAWIQNYCGYKIPYASEERAAQMLAHEAVKAMPCWPNEGSIAVIEDLVVVKFQELSR